MEIKPLFYLAVTLVLMRWNALPSREDFARHGVVLAALLVSETLIRSLMAGALERPIGSGEVNYDAALLMVSLVFATCDRTLARRYATLIFVGLVASFSRTSLIAACLILALAATIPFTLRLAMIGAAISGVLASFAIRGLDIGSVESMDRYWMWFAGVSYLFDNPSAHGLVAAPGGDIPVEVPLFVADLWLDQQHALGLTGIYPFHFHAFWLRLAMGWGWLLALAALVFLAAGMARLRAHAPEALPFAAVCAVLGMTMGLVYLSNVAVVMILAGAVVLQRARANALSAPRVSTHREMPSHA